MFGPLKTEILAKEKLSRLNFTVENWDVAQRIFLSINTHLSHLKLLKVELEKKENANRNYLEVFQKLHSKKEISVYESGVNVFSLHDNSNVCSTYEEALNQAKIRNKSILLFFSGYTCVNAKRMENDLFCNAEISECLLEKFILLELYTDDMRLESDETDSTITRGKRNSELELDLLGFNRQPIVVILTQNGEVENSLGYTQKKDAFWDWIK